MKITCFDVETANRRSTSMCAAGIAVFEDGVLTESRHWLIRPPKGHGYFRPDFIEIHGITRRMVHNAPEFRAVAPEILDFFANTDIVVAHKAAFDMRILRSTLTHYGIQCPTFNYICTVLLARRVWPELANHRLDTVANHIGHEFRHHNAQADAEAAGRVMLAMMKQTKARNTIELTAATGVHVRNLSLGGCART